MGRQRPSSILSNAWCACDHAPPTSERARWRDPPLEGFVLFRSTTIEIVAKLACLATFAVLSRIFRHRRRARGYERFENRTKPAPSRA